MKKLFKNIKNIDFNKNIILKIFLLVFLLIFYIFIFLNHDDILFLSAGFNFGANFQIYIFDVGQATSACVILPDGKVWVLDTGRVESQDKLVKKLEYILNKNGIRKIDTLLISHSDLDHIGGGVEILNKFEVSNILRPKILSKNEVKQNDYKVVENEEYQKLIDSINIEKNCEVKFIENDKISRDNYEIEIFAGEKDYYAQTNSYSPIVIFSCFERTFMFTGDVTEVREKEFARNVSEKIDIDFLLISHHGSSSSTKDDFLSVVTPKFGFVSSGSYQYPSREVVTRLTNAGVKNIYSTFEKGMIGIYINTNSAFKIVCMSNSIDLPLIVVLISILFLIYIRYDFFECDRKLRYFLRKR